MNSYYIFIHIFIKYTYATTLRGLQSKTDGIASGFKVFFAPPKLLKHSLEKCFEHKKLNFPGTNLKLLFRPSLTALIQRSLFTGSEGKLKQKQYHKYQFHLICFRILTHGKKFFLFDTANCSEMQNKIVPL